MLRDRFVQGPEGLETDGQGDNEDPADDSPCCFE